MKEDKQVQFFFDKKDWIANMRSATSFHLAIWLAFHTKYGSAEVVVDTASRREMEELFKVTRATIIRAFHELIDNDVIAKKLDVEGKEIPNQYIVNPKIFWYGWPPKRKYAIKQYRTYFM